MCTTRILIVDDHAAVRADLRTLLELVDGIEVVGEAASGEEAVRQAGLLDPDIVLMDLDLSTRSLPGELSSPNMLKLPELDGCTAIRILKDRQPALTIFVLTVHGYPAAEQAALQAGADEFFVKGRDSEILLNVIRNFR